MADSVGGKDAVAAGADLASTGIDTLSQTFGKVLDESIHTITTYGLDLLGAVVILVVGFWLAGRVSSATKAALAKTGKVDEMLQGFFGSLANYMVIIFTILAVLNRFGVQTASIIAVLGAASLAIGLALQGTLSNVAAGVMLLIFRPFKVGDYVDVAGQSGTVREVNLFFTLLKMPDNTKIVVPNGEVWGGSVVNYTASKTRRVEIIVGISYEDSIDEAIASITGVIAAEPRALKEPEPLVAVAELGDSSVNIVVRVWAAKGDFWAMKFALTKSIKERLDEDGISIPYPCRTIYHVNNK